MTTRETMQKIEREFLEVFSESQKSHLITNKAGIVGILEEDFEFSHTIHEENFFKTFVTTNRISSYEDHILVVLPEKLLCKRICGGSYVKIFGNFRSFNVRDENGKSHLKLFLFAKEILLNPAANMTNMIYLNGFVCKEPIFRTTPSGRTITELIIAVNRNYGNSDYIPCITWGDNAWDAGMLPVGAPIECWGRIQSRKYHKKTKEAYEVSISELI